MSRGERFWLVWVCVVICLVLAVPTARADDPSATSTLEL
jgi:hypothetical protein